MKKYPSFRFVIEVLLVTNIWIFFYNSLLSLLNSRFPPKISETFYITGAAPEPFEIPLYIGLSFLFVIFIFLLYRYILKTRSQAINNRTPNSNYSCILKVVVFLLLFSIFIVNIGEYPLRGNPDPYPPQTNTSIYQIAFVLYVVTVVFLTAQLTIIKRMIVKLGQQANLVMSLLVLIIIALFIFEPNFPISGMDYSFFSGPIWEVVHGRTIITETPSQYGILPILFFVFLSKLQLFRISYLPYFFWTLFVIEYFLIFYLMSKIGRSFLFALLALFSIVTVNYYSISHIPLYTPQAGPLRWLPMFFTLFLFFRAKKIDAKPMIFFIALSCYWILDTGLYLRNKYSSEKELIDKYLQDDKVAILHADDTYLLYMTDKQNLLLINPQTSIVSQSDLTFALQDVYRVCPQKIAVDCRFVGKCSENWTFAGITSFIQPYLLDALQKNCHTLYQPTVCTNQLCIAESINIR